MASSRIASGLLAPSRHEGHHDGVRGRHLNGRACCARSGSVATARGEGGVRRTSCAYWQVPRRAPHHLHASGRDEVHVPNAGVPGGCRRE
eukprot:9904139-Heterocapsa_arctica.AAC.1